MIEAVVFDLDDTLYLERDFVASGFRNVAHHISRETGFCFQEVFGLMMNTYAASGRRAVFPRVISELLGNSVPVTDLVWRYRNHMPRICLLPGYGGLLKRLRLRYKLGIVTDGIPEVQRCKVLALNLQKRMDSIIYSWDNGPDKGKPDPLSLSQVLGELGVDPVRAIYVGDNASKDCLGAHRAGMRFVQVHLSGSAASGMGTVFEEPDFVIGSLHDLPRILETAD